MRRYLGEYQSFNAPPLYTSFNDIPFASSFIFFNCVRNKIMMAVRGGEEGKIKSDTSK